MDETSLDRPLLVFDGDCCFCRAWIEYWKQLTGDRVAYAPYQEVSPQFPEIPEKEFARAVQLVMPGGEFRSAAHAVFTTLSFLPGKRWMLSSYQQIPGVAAASEAAYRLVARHRSLGYWLTRILWGIPVQPASYSVSSWLFLRALGAIYFIAFASFGVQAAGLIGSRGILPVAEFMKAVRQYYGAWGFWHVPSILWWNSGDSLIRGTWIAGALFAMLLMIGVNSRVLRLALFILYLSLTTAGQEFMGYQWDALLLEAGFLAMFLDSSRWVARLGKWLLFRLMFLSGAVKLLSGDASWHNFAALPVHYETQPLPTPLAWYMFQLPGCFQRFSVGIVFIVELIVPFLIFAPRRLRHFAACTIAAFEVLIFLTGNYAFFNLLAIALCIFLLDDADIKFLPQKILRRVSNVNKNPSPLRRSLCAAFVVFVLFVSCFQMLGVFSRLRWSVADWVIQATAPFEIVNTYGLFAVMTTSRPEIIVEGSKDGENWLAYEFRYKPGDLGRRPTWIEPHQPRLDWQMWFAALGDYHSDPWIIHFMARLLEGSPEVLALMGRNPFPDAPPRYVRALVYDYRFTSPGERKLSGQWWQRDSKGTYVPVLSLRGP